MSVAEKVFIPSLEEQEERFNKLFTGSDAGFDRSHFEKVKNSAVAYTVPIILPNIRANFPSNRGFDLPEKFDYLSDYGVCAAEACQWAASKVAFGSRYQFLTECRLSPQYASVREEIEKTLVTPFFVAHVALEVFYRGVKFDKLTETALESKHLPLCLVDYAFLIGFIPEVMAKIDANTICPVDLFPEDTRFADECLGLHRADNGIWQISNCVSSSLSGSGTSVFVAR